MQKLIDGYLNFVKDRSHSRKTHTTYQGALQTFQRIVGEDAPLTKETYIKFLDNSTYMKPNTQALHRSAIRGLYSYWANRTPGMDASFFKQTDNENAMKLGKRRPKFNREAIEKIIQHVKSMRNNLEELRDRTFILLLVDTGLRVSEACNIYLNDIDWLERRVPVIGKGDKEALVKFSERAEQAMKEYIQARGNPPVSQPLFILHSKKAGEQIQKASPGVMWYHVKLRATEAGIDRKSIRIHDFRHYFVTIVYHAKGIKMAQTLARHESIGTTDRYTHLVEDEGKAYDEIFNR